VILNITYGSELEVPL